MEEIISDEKTGQVIAQFDVQLYPADCIFKAAKEYRDSYWIFVDGNNKVLQVVLKPKSNDVKKCPGEKPDLDKLGLEFYNRVLTVSSHSQQKLGK